MTALYDDTKFIVTLGLVMMCGFGLTGLLH